MTDLNLNVDNSDNTKVKRLSRKRKARVTCRRENTTIEDNRAHQDEYNSAYTEEEKEIIQKFGNAERKWEDYKSAESSVFTAENQQ